MTLQFSPNVEQLFLEMMSTGMYASEDHLMIEALESLTDSEEDLKAIEEGLASFRRGEKRVTAKEAFEKLRKKYSVDDAP